MTRYKVWHIPQFPMQAFEVFTEDIKTAVLLANTLANYDLFQLEHNVKPDYSNVQGIMQWQEDEQEWWDLDEYELEQLLNDCI